MTKPTALSLATADVLDRFSDTCIIAQVLDHRRQVVMHLSSTGHTSRRSLLPPRLGRTLEAARLRLLDLTVARRCRRLVDGLDLPTNATVADLRELIEDLQQRHIVVRYVDREVVRAQTRQPSAKAAWLPGVDGQIDLLLVDAAAWHGGRDHNLRHEFGHMLLGHACSDNGELVLVERLEMVDEAAAKNFLAAKPLPSLARGEWMSAREREAELVATMLGRRLVAAHTSTARTETSLADARARHMMGLVDEVAPRRWPAMSPRRQEHRPSRPVELSGL